MYFITLASPLTAKGRVLEKEWKRKKSEMHTYTVESAPNELSYRIKSLVFHSSYEFAAVALCTHQTEHNQQHIFGSVIENKIRKQLFLQQQNHFAKRSSEPKRISLEKDSNCALKENCLLKRKLFIENQFPQKHFFANWTNYLYFGCLLV